ncbi:MAG: AAA family ATPase [Phycisphaerae bacterium]
MTSANLTANLVDHVPPAARADEAEETLLGCCLNWPRPSLDVAARHVGPDDFFDLRYQRLFAFLLGLGEDTRDAFDLASLARTLEQDGALEAVGGRDELVRLSDTAATKETAVLHVKAVHEAAMTRRLRDFCLNTLRDTGRADFRPADVLPAIEARVARLAHSNGHGGAVCVCMADVEPEEVRWLWPERIALGKPTILVGDPGLGKSFITLDLAARVTTGAAWPDGAPGGEPGGGVILSAEDGLADTIRPRLDAAGADVTRITALQAVQVANVRGGGSLEEPVDLSAKGPETERTVKQWRA